MRKIDTLAFNSCEKAVVTNFEEYLNSHHIMFEESCADGEIRLCGSNIEPLYRAFISQELTKSFAWLCAVFNSMSTASAVSYIVDIDPKNEFVSLEVDSLNEYSVFFYKSGLTCRFFVHAENDFAYGRVDTKCAVFNHHTNRYDFYTLESHLFGNGVWAKME